MATAGGCGIGGSWMSLMMMKKKKKNKPISSYSSYHHHLAAFRSSSSSSSSVHTTLTFFTSSSSSASHRQAPRHHHLLSTRAAQTNNNNPSPPPPPDLSCGYLPDANFYKIEAILRPWRVPQVSSALLKMGIRGVTVSDVRGFGAQGGLTERQAGSEYSEDKFLNKVKMEIVVSKEQVEAVIDKIIEEARTGEIGDGKIFLLPVTDVIRVRTGERGENAERMLGGRSDMSSSV